MRSARNLMRDEILQSVKRDEISRVCKERWDLARVGYYKNRSWGVVDGWGWGGGGGCADLAEVYGESRSQHV